MNQKCTMLPVGMNTIGKVSSRVLFFKIHNRETYMAHYIRHTASFLANDSADITTIIEDTLKTVSTKTDLLLPHKQIY